MPTKVRSRKVNREAILHQLECVQPGLSPKEIIEQSSCFVFQDNQVMTYNDEIACCHNSDLKLSGAVQAAPLMALLRKLPEDEIEVEAGDGELLVTGNKRKAGIRMESEILLPVEKVETPKKWKDLPADFGEAVAMVQECAGKNENDGFSITCVHLHPEWIEASDNYQIARYTMQLPIKAPSLVRRDSIKHIVALDMTEFSETESWLHFRNASGLRLSCRRYLEKFKEFSKFLKVKGEPTTLPKGLGESADMAEIFSAENTDSTEVTVELRPGKLRLKGMGATGWYSEVKKLKYHGQPLSFMIAPKLLAEITRRHNECEIAEERLVVRSGNFIYVSCLSPVEEEK